MLQIPAATFEVDRVKTFLRLLLVSAGYYCLDAKHLDVTVLVAGKDDNGFIILMTHAPDPMLLPSTRAEVPPELAFLKLPVHHVVVTPGQWPNDGREVLLGLLDDDLRKHLTVDKPGEYGILLLKRPA